MNLLFICTHNRCRSILSEAIANKVGQGKIKAFSAGSQPSGQVHPLSIKYLEQNGYNTEGLASQSWHDFENSKIDLTITVCDSAAGESCPLWFGDTIKLHWGLADPSKIEGSEAQIGEAFQKTIKIIEQRIEKLCTLDLNNTNTSQLTQELKALVATN